MMQLSYGCLEWTERQIGSLSATTPKTSSSGAATPSDTIHSGAATATAIVSMCHRSELVDVARLR